MSMYDMYPNEWQASIEVDAVAHRAPFYGGLGHTSDYGTEFDVTRAAERTKVESSHRPLSHDVAHRVVEHVVPAVEEM